MKISRELPSILSDAMKRLSKRAQVKLIKAGLCEAINNNFRQSLGPLAANWRTTVSDGVAGKPEYLGTDVWWGCEESVVDFEEVELAFKGTNFGEGQTSRQILEGGVLKIAAGYHNGYTLKNIILKLGLASSWNTADDNYCVLTEKGKKFLYEAFDTEPKQFTQKRACDIQLRSGPDKPETETKCAECDFKIDIEWAKKNEGLCQVCLVKAKEQPVFIDSKHHHFILNSISQGEPVGCVWATDAFDALDEFPKRTRDDHTATLVSKGKCPVCEKEEADGVVPAYWVKP